MKKNKFTLLVALGMAWLAVVAGARAQSVGVQFVGAGGTGINTTSPDALTPSQSAGAPGFAQTNWNNFGSSGDSVPVTNSVGEETSVFINWNSGYTGTSGTTGLGTPDGNLFDGFLLSWGPGTSVSLGNSVYDTTITDMPLVYASGIHSWYQSEGAEGYSIVLYINGYTYYEQSERWIQSVSGNPLADTMVGGPDLTSHLFDVCTANFNGTYIQVPATATSAGSAAYGANYEVFYGLTNDVILLRNQCDSGYGGGLNGFQIVPIFPAPPVVNTPAFAPGNANYAGVAVTVTGSALGDPFHTNLWYQWYSDNATGGGVTNLIWGATNTTFTVTPTNNATTYNIQYVLVVTNIFGVSTSSVATLTVNPAVAPILTQDTTPGPVDGVATNFMYVGGSFTYSAAFGGTPPVYLWQLNSVGILGATNTTLTLNNLQLSASGDYDLTATNSVGGNASTPVPLVVLPDPAAPTASAPYDYDVFTNQPKAYWRLNETVNPNAGNNIPAYDSSGNGFDGTYGALVTDDVPGPVGSGFVVADTAAAFTEFAAQGTVVLPPLNLNANTVTFTAWIYPTGQEPASAGMLFNRNGSDAAGFGFGSTNNGTQTELGYTWNGNSGSTYNFNSGLFPPIDQWSFVALTITPTNATIYLYYTDGVSVTNLGKAVNPIAHTSESFSGGTTWLGGDSSSVNRTFGGSIGEVAVFGNSLSESQLQNLFLTGTGVAGAAPFITTDVTSTNDIAFAGQPLSISAVGDGAPVPSYQWQVSSGGAFTPLANGGGTSGVNSSTLTFANDTAAANLEYRLVLANALGTATSSVVAVSVVPSTPQINAILADHPTALWLLNETNNPATGAAVAYDFVGGLDGLYGTGASNAFDGVTGPLPSDGLYGFPTNNGALETFSGTANSYVAGGALNLNNNAVTITAWINPSGTQPNPSGIVMCRDGTVGDFGSTQAGLCYEDATDLGINWNNSYWSWDSGLTPPIGVWSFVAMVVTPTGVTLYMDNTNGSASSVYDATMVVQAFDATTYIGSDPFDLSGRAFNGEISQVAVFNSSLSQAQIQGLYSAGAPQLQFTGIPSAGNLTLNWNVGSLLESTNLLGPWVPVTGVSSPYTVPTTNHAGFFRVQLP